MKSCAKKCMNNNKSCQERECRYWIDYKDDVNCTFVAIHNHGSMTLRQVAERTGVTFARIKQIEQKLLKKLGSKKYDFIDFK